MKKIKTWFSSLSLQGKIGTLVLSFHLLLVFGCFVQNLFPLKKKKIAPIAIRTLVEEPPQKTPSLPPPKKQTQIASSKPSLKKVAPTPKKRPPLEELQKSLAALSKQEPAPFEKPLSIPSKLKSKKPSFEPIDTGPSYEETLVHFLQSELNLPEQGDVQVEMEISSTGKLLSCHITHSKSFRNEIFLKEQLPLLSYPPPKDLKKFSITFKSDFFYPIRDAK